MNFEKNTFGRRLKSMLKVDFRRMFTSRLFYIMVAIAFVIPVLVLVMTTSFSGEERVDHKTGEVVVVESEPMTNAWQVVESVSGESSGSGMDMMNMCNINLLFFGAAIFVCLFVTDDFKSGYSKNLFAVRAKKTDYVISKTAAGFVGSAAMILAYFAGTILGGMIAGMSFDTGIAGVRGVVMCMLAKIFLMLVFVAIAVLAGVIGKQKTWLSILVSMGIGMLLFNMISMLTPLNSTVMNVLICLIGGGLFSIGVGSGSNLVLQKTSLV